MQHLLSNHWETRSIERFGRVIRFREADYLWQRGRTLTSRDFWRFQIDRNPSSEYRLVCVDGKQCVFVRGCWVDVFITLFVVEVQ